MSRQRRPFWYKPCFGSGVGALIALCVTAQAASALAWTETPDAPSFPSGQAPAGIGALTSISGTTNSSTSDREDMYRICVLGGTFSAKVSSATFDTGASDLTGVLGVGLGH